MRFRKQYDFRPDRTEPSLLERLYLTKSQRLSIVKWMLYGVLMVLLSLVQDVIMSRLQIMGATTDLVCCGILLISLLHAPETGGIFALVASILYFFSGSAPGAHSIVLLTALGLLINILRQSLLRKGFGSAFLCTAAGMMLYELMIFGAALFVGYTTVARLRVFLVTGAVSLAAVPLLYPIAVSIGKIGGASWKD